jgi:putative transcriptional regulator
MRCWLALVLAVAAAEAPAQPNGLLLVAKPALRDPNFVQTVVLVTRTPDGGAVGVILNRPGERRLRNWPQPLYTGGPVMQQVVIALFAAQSPPREAAFSVLPQVYLSMHPKNLEALLAEPSPRMRLFSGFSGWAPRQLEAEIDGGGWYVMRATPALLFRQDTSGMWNELVELARGARTSRDPAPFVAAILVP